MRLIVLPESDPLDLTPPMRRAWDGDAAPQPLPRWAGWLLALLLSLVLWVLIWAALGWAAVALVDVIYHALY